ncbi:YqgQ family protein [Isobaculum melis]|uniref:Uncharacterized protein YqgQ n=1 Tax=Isobaculum melis TaxID=142588 RepID=A0A1H9RTI6_9LACT|nr:YqgQ family protein [Isobaculum melis]SER75858.1 Uncharacterized protein YqgQ [Isobaculum melis]
MKELYDVQQLLKRFNIYVYLGKRKWDIELMLQEIQSLHQSGVITDQEFKESLLILKREHRIEEQKESGGEHIE